MSEIDDHGLDAVRTEFIRILPCFHISKSVDQHSIPFHRRSTTIHTKGFSPTGQYVMSDPEIAS